MRNPLARSMVASAILPLALFGLAGLIVCTALASPSLQPPKDGSIRRCRLAVFVNDPDPAGLYLRRAPAADAPIVTTIVDGDAMLDVTGSSGKWLRVERVRAADGTVQFEGEAWTFGPLTGVRAKRSMALHAAPRQTSAVSATMPADQIGAVQECDDRWVRVRLGNSVGWMGPDTHCGNSVTDCV